LLDEGIADTALLDRMDEDVQREITLGAEFALEAPYPALTEVDQDVYAEP
jgi:TPP-dependent pyruvate/acetoin dehydrogenase alpha subunit